MKTKVFTHRGNQGLKIEKLGKDEGREVPAIKSHGYKPINEWVNRLFSNLNFGSL